MEAGKIVRRLFPISILGERCWLRSDVKWWRWEKWLDSGCVVMAEAAGFSDSLDVGMEEEE